MKDKTVVSKATTYSIFPNDNAAREAFLVVLTPIAILIIIVIIFG